MVDGQRVDARRLGSPAMDEHRNPHYFVSFCYDDDIEVNGRPGWVANFTKELEVKYGDEVGLPFLRAGQEAKKKGFGYSFSKNAGQGSIDEWIEGDIKKSDFLIVVLSPHLRRSEYCTSERQLFLSQVCKNNRSEFDKRVFIVQLDRDTLPDDLRGMRGTYPFFKELKGAGAGRVERLGYPLPIPGRDTDYFNAVSKLAVLMKESTHTYFPETKSQGTPAKKPAMSFASKQSHRIYVEGAAPIDSKFVRDTAAKLRDRGFTNTEFSEVHKGVDPQQADPEVDFKNLVDKSEIVVVLRQNAQKTFARNRHSDARRRFSNYKFEKKDPRNVMLIDAADSGTMAEDLEKRIFSLAKAQPHQCADRIADVLRAKK